MKGTINIHKTGMGYFHKDLIDGGYVGRVETLANACTITLIRPGTKLTDVKRSIEITLQDLELRISQEEQ